MELVYFLGLIVLVLLAIIYRSGRKKNGFVKDFSRSDYMRDLNKKMENKKP